MIRSIYQNRLAGLILGLRPTTAHIYGIDKRFSVDNLTNDGLAAWTAGIKVLGSDMADPDARLSPTETWVTEWIATEHARDAARWDDASSVLELLALSLGPGSLDPSYLRPDDYWTDWIRNIHDHRTRMNARRSTPSGDTADLALHCIELARTHRAPHGLVELLTDIADIDHPVQHRPEVFRPLSTPGERLQLSALIASIYSVQRRDCAAAEARLLDQRPPLVEDCGRAQQTA